MARPSGNPKKKKNTLSFVHPKDPVVWRSTRWGTVGVTVTPEQTAAMRRQTEITAGGDDAAK